MRNFYLIFKKELKSYFTSPIAYVVITIFMVISGYFFYNIVATFATISYQATINPMVAKQYGLLNVTEIVVRPLFGNISVIMLLMMPLLTMRLFSEEKKTGTIELLLTYPVTDMEVLLGKFFACLAVFVLMLVLTGTYPLLLIIYGQPEIGPVITGYLGLLVLGASFISLGIFASSLSENQIIAATVAFGALIFFWMMSFSSALVDPSIGKIISYISFTDHLEAFAKGVVDTEDIIYYAVFIILFMFLTLRILESNKWRG
ncbi:MAG: ABC transporter permease [Deltaproteobacteria bacterium GWC2_42_11]|nr:MAG: ABC transporter permease [Deltaproteobacteria bacterium GWC2_42_11]HBO84556.1 ABC transporter permease [Deltaproteobacteria bacterium]